MINPDDNGMEKQIAAPMQHRWTKSVKALNQVDTTTEKSMWASKIRVHQDNRPRRRGRLVHDGRLYF